MAIVGLNPSTLKTSIRSNMVKHRVSSHKSGTVVH